MFVRRCISGMSVVKNSIAGLHYRVPDFIASVREPEWLAKSETEVFRLRSTYQTTSARFDDKSITNYFRVKLGFESNRLEGNSLSESDVVTLVQGKSDTIFFACCHMLLLSACVMSGMTIDGKPLQDLLDVCQHDVAVVELLVRAGRHKLPVSAELIKNTHKLCICEPIQV